jgi:phosphomannomutase
MKNETVQSLLSNSPVSFGTSGLRGLVSDLDASVCHAVTAGFLDHGLKNRGIKSASEVLFAHDLRPSSPRIALAVSAAIKRANMIPVFCGAIPTPALALASAKRHVPAIMVTGSHIPFDRNGIKFYYPDGEMTKDDEVPITTSQLIVSAPYEEKNLPALKEWPEELYFQRNLECFDGVLNGLKVGHFQHSAVGRDLTARLLEALGAEVTILERTEEFVPVDTEAVSQKDREKALNWNSEYGFDLIVSTDGDGDRPLLADECGNYFQGDLLGVFTARYLGAKTIVTPVSSNSAVERSGWFDRVIRTKIGSPHVIAGMKGTEATIGYEANGGTLTGADFPLSNGSTLSALPTRDALLPILATVALAKRENMPLSRLHDLLPARFTRSDRLTEWPTENSSSLIADLIRDDAKLVAFMNPFGDIKSIDDIDGLRVTMADDNIIHLRPSGNAPEFRAYVESDTQESADILLSQVLDVLRKHKP